MSNLNAAPAVPKYVKRFSDRHGNPRFYFRRKGWPSIALEGQPGSPTFNAAYEAAANREPLHRARSAATAGYVYAVRVVGFDLVKIGYSLNPKRRLTDLETGSGMIGGLDMLLKFPAKPAIERALHRQFAGQRLFGEWFRLSGPVAEWLEANSCLPGRRLNRLADLNRPRSAEMDSIG